MYTNKLIINYLPNTIKPSIQILGTQPTYHTPNKEIYRFLDDVCVEDENGEFVEVPITVYNRNILK